MVLESNTLDVLFVKDGQQGEDGKVLYTWIKYAKDANGTGMTDDPNGAIYIGISYNNESSTESNDPTQYAWTKIQGADGKKGEDAYTIFLENENISFATDKNRNPLSEQAYTSGITIMKGAKPVTDFIIGDIAKTQGIAVAKTDTAIAISVVNGNPLPNDSGEIEIPITVGGTVFKKILTWTCAKKGDQGEQGERGLQGIQGPQGIQGVAGKDGTNGKTAYFHIKYSSVANPTSSSQLTETPSTYIGTYVDFTETDSTDPKKYTWSQFVGSQGPKGEQGIAGVGVDGKTSYLHIAYANSADGKTGFSTSDSTNKSYIGQYTDFTPNDSTDYTKYSWSLIRGKDGTDGVSPTVSVTKNGKTTTITITDKNGTHTQTVKDGTDGTPGQTGKDGKTTYFHVKYSNDGGQTFTSNSGEDVGAYIGTCTDYNQADPTTVGAYTWARIKGEKGDQGVRGEKGKDGTSVTITNKSITYQLSTSGTTIPTGTWQTSPQTIPEGQYQWTKTSVTYSDGNKTESYSISYHGKNGSNGTSVKTTSTSVKYQVGDSGTTKPTGTWQANVPTVVQGKYLWTQTIVNYSDGNSTESYSVAYRGIDGNNGVNGMNAATIYLYQRATSTPNKPSNTLTYTFSTTKITGTLNNSWSTAIPTGTDAVYVTVASVSSKNDTATIATSAWSAPVVLAQNGKTGSDGKAGLNVATIYLYQRNTSKPSKPSASVTYTFSTGVASGLNNGWSQKIPDGTNPLYVTLATASSNTATDTILSSEWSDVVVMAQNGEDGISPKVSLSKSGNTTTISIIDATGTHTQTVKDGTNGTPGAAGKDGKTSYFHVKYSNDGGKTFTSNSGEDTGIYMGSYTDYTETDSTDVKKYNWVKVKGDKGDTGQKGQNAKNLSITPSSQYFKSTDGGKTFAPNAITIKPTIQGEISFGKWQYSIDGGVSFADVVSGQKGLTISNNVLTVSKDSSLYSDAVTMVTFRAVASDSSFYDTCSIAKIYDVNDIGDGRNLWITRDNITLQACEKDKYIYTTTGTSAVCIGADGSSVGTNTIALQTGTKYTISFVISSPSEVGNALWYFCTALNSTGVKNYGGYSVKLVTGENIVSQTITVDTSCDAAGLVIYNLPTDCIIKDIQVEKGSSPTGWTPAPEDVQTAILSTKSEISDVSLKVDNNKQAIEQRVEKTTYQQDLKLVKGDISKANEGLNKWRYEIYPKSLFASEYQGKSTMDVFAKNTNLTPSQSVLINDMDLSIAWNYDNNYIGYALTFAKFSAAKSVAITFAHDDGAHIYLNGKLIGGSDAYSQTGESLTLGFVKGWNCIEVVVNEGASTEGFKLGITISAISECQLMNCYYGTPVARQSHITNQLVENTTNIEGVTTTMQKVMTTVGGSDRIDEFVNNYNKTIESEKQFKKTIGETYTTKDEFNGLEIGGRNLVLDSKPQKQGSSYAVVSRHLSIDLQAGVTYTISFCGRVVDGDGSLVVYLYRNDWKDSIQKSTKSKENTVISWQFTPKISGAFQIEAYSFLSQGVAGGNVYLDWFKVEKGNKATDWTPAPEDDEINGQNLVSNLPSNWEQGTVTEGSAIGTTYANTKSSSAGSIRPKELIPVSGDITISIAYSNQSKKPVRHWIAAYDVNKNYLGNNYVSNAWNNFPRTLNMKDAKYIAIMIGYTDSSAITPSDISQICLKIERGTSATPFTLAPEDVNGKIINVETIANQTAKKFEWIVKGGDSSSNFTLTDRVADLVAERINFKGLVKFSGLSTDAKSDILNSFEVGGINLISDTRDMKSWAKGGKLTITYDQLDIKNNTNAIKVVNSKSTAGNAYLEPPNRGPLSSGKYTVSFYAKTDSTSGADVSVLITDEYTKTFKINNIWTQYIITFDVANDIPVTNNFFWFNFFGTTEPIYFCYVKLEKGNKPTDWSPNPEDYLPQANLVSNWTTNSTWIDGGKIYTGSITADKIATDAIKSRNYISSGGTQGSFLNLSDGSFQSPNLSWDANGNLIAKNANLSGQITATKGSIGGWSVDNYSIYTTYDADQNIFGSGISGTKGKYVLWAGETNNAIGANRSSDTPTDASLVIYNNGGLEVRKTMVGNDKKNHLYTTILQSGQINLKMDDNYIGTITATDTISSNSTVTMSHVSMAAKKGYGWSILHTDDSGNLISDIQRDPSDTKIKINSPITVSSTDISKYNAIETTGDVVVSGKIHANYGSNKIQLNPDNNGSIELYGYTPFIDFHYGNSDSDYTSRIIAQEWGLQIVGTATVTGDLYCDAHIYTCTNGHFSWAGQTDAYLGCGNYSGGNNIYYYANYHAFYVNNDSGSGMMYINTNGVTSRVGFTKTSDERIKKNFESFDDNIIDAYMNIEPVKYQLKQSSNDNYHFGFKAQHVDKVFSDYGDTYNESFDICTSRPIDPDKAKELYGVDDMTEEYGLRYDELIAPTTYMVQHIYKELESTKGELAKVKQEKADLETRLHAIEAKLGL